MPFCEPRPVKRGRLARTPTRQAVRSLPLPLAAGCRRFAARWTVTFFMESALVRPVGYLELRHPAILAGCPCANIRANRHSDAITACGRFIGPRSALMEIGMRRFLAVLALSTLTACTTPCTPQDPCEPRDGGEGLFQASETWQRYGEPRQSFTPPPPPSPVAPPPPPPSFMRRHHRPSHRRLARPGANGTAQSGTAFRKVEYGGVLADRMALRPLRSFARRLHAPRSCRRLPVDGTKHSMMFETEAATAFPDALANRRANTRIMRSPAAHHHR